MLPEADCDWEGCRVPALMLPIERVFDPDAIDARFSVFTRLPGYVAVLALAPVKEGCGQVTVDGVALTRWEQITVYGLHLLLIPVGEVAREHGHSYRVVLEGFRTRKGRRFPRCVFRLRTSLRRTRLPEYDENDAQALEAAREGMVLLKNDNGALPLPADATLNCFGRGQHLWRVSAAGASMINPRWKPGLHEAVAEHSGFTLNEALSEHYLDPRAGLPDAETLARARERCDCALVFIERHSGEMQDNRLMPGEYALTAGEKEMLAAARANFSRVIVILNTGYPIAMDWLRECPVDAVLYAGYAGMLSAWALVEILDGRTNPSGHLPDTWPWAFADNPVSRNFPTPDPDAPYVPEDAVGVRVYYEEDVYLGYRYFDTFGVPVAFPFGHGLSYTRFELEPVGLERRKGAVVVRVRVRNAGERAGKAVAQLYAEPPEGRLEKPARMLAGFEKTRLLAPGEEQVLEITARYMDMASFDEARSAWVLEAGEYALSVGESLARRIPCGSLRFGEARVLEEVLPLGAPVERIDRLTRENPEVKGGRSGMVPLGEQIAVAAPRMAYAPAPLKRSGRRVRWQEVVRDPKKLEAFVAQLSLYELCRLNVCGGSRWMPWQDGAAGFSPRLPWRGLPSFVVADANAGLNLKRPNIGFPASSVIAATFNRQIAWQVGRVIASECPEHGVCLNLGPGMNLHRSQLCGRYPEYFSEDPLLTGEMAGWQGKGLVEGGVGCCYKHMFCNGSELGRLGSHSVVSEQALRELYLRPFAIAFGVQKPRAVMTSYNALNGLYPGENAALLQGVIRGEWGFDGAIMSDWGSYRTVDAVEMVKAGNCWITPGGPKWVWRVWRAARRGEIDRAVLENNVKALLKGLAGL